MPLHTDPHPLAGQKVRLKLAKPMLHGDSVDGQDYRLEDWWDRVSGGRSWMVCDDNSACLDYAIRSGVAGLPTDNEVVYGKVGAFGHLIHVSELVPLPETANVD